MHIKYWYVSKQYHYYHKLRLLLLLYLQEMSTEASKIWTYKYM